MQLCEILSDPCLLSPSKLFYPNKLASIESEGKHIGAVVAIQSPQSGNFGLNVAGLEYVMKAEKEGRIAAGHVVLGRRESGASKPQFVASESAKDVYGKLRDTPARAGQWGDYWLITSAFREVGDDQDVPF